MTTDTGSTIPADDIFRMLQFTMEKEKSKEDIYHLVEVALWKECSEAQDYVPPTFTQDGFIHAAAEANVLLDIANLYYQSVEGDFLVIRIRPSLLKATSTLKFEAPAPVGDQETKQDEALKYPHIYGPLNVTAVVKEYEVKRNDDGSFVSVVGL
jgi:uncharacterized protein (DUF952 family)